jgi:hypothetical protein
VEFGLNIPVRAEMSALLPHKKTSTLVAPASLVRHWQAGRAFCASPSPPQRRPTPQTRQTNLRVALGRTMS